MADDNKPGSNLANSGVIVAALAAMGVYYFHHEAPLWTCGLLRMHRSRSVPHHKLSMHAYGKILSPRFRNLSKNQAIKILCKNAREPSATTDVASHHWMRKTKKRLCSPSPCRGSLSGRRERRRRTRYAVLAGLNGLGSYRRTRATSIISFGSKLANPPAIYCLETVRKAAVPIRLCQVPPHERPTTTWKQWAYIPYEWFQPRSLTDEYNNQAFGKRSSCCG